MPKIIKNKEKMNVGGFVTDCFYMKINQFIVIVT